MSRHSMPFHLVVAALLVGAPACGDDARSAPAPVATVTPSTAPRTVPPPTEPAAPAKLPLVVDTDLAADDIVALSYLTAHPGVELLAVSVSGTGEVRCPHGTDVARGLLAAMGHPHVPVACGRSQPLAGDRAFPDEWRAAADDAWGVAFPITTDGDDPDATELLTQVLTAAPAPPTLLALGPLTNLAELLAARPELDARLERIVAMGGALDVPGNVVLDEAAGPLAAEWNLYVDPQAAAQVLASGVPLTLVTLDATNHVPLTDASIQRLAANDTTDATRRVRTLFEGFPPPYLWDPLAAIAATDPELVPVEATPIAVLVDGEDAGRTVAAPDGTEVDVAIAPDADAVLDHFLRTLAGVGAETPLAVPTTVPVLGEVTVGFDGTVCSYDGPDPLDAGAYRVVLEPGGEPYAVVVAQLLGSSTLAEALAFIDEHPDQEPPMVGATVFLGVEMPDPPDSVVFEPERVAIVCVVDEDVIVPAVEVTVLD